MLWNEHRYITIIICPFKNLNPDLCKTDLKFLETLYQNLKKPEHFHLSGYVNLFDFVDIPQEIKNLKKIFQKSP